MLRHLYIKNYALIDELDIDFYSGFSVITGETGAGKSIILGAIGLLLGQRADSKVVKSEQLKCIIEATFFIDGTEHIMRRELTSAGKSRSFIDDELSTLQEMREFGERLLDVHSQHQNLLLQKEDFQLRVLDIIAGNDIAPYCAAYNAYLDAEQQLRDMIAADSQAHQDEELMRFQLDELSKANLDADEKRQEHFHQFFHRCSRGNSAESAAYRQDGGEWFRCRMALRRTGRLYRRLSGGIWKGWNRFSGENSSPDALFLSPFVADTGYDQYAGYREILLPPGALVRYNGMLFHRCVLFCFQGHRGSGDNPSIGRPSQETLTMETKRSGTVQLSAMARV